MSEDKEERMSPEVAKRVGDLASKLVDVAAEAMDKNQDPRECITGIIWFLAGVLTSENVESFIEGLRKYVAAREASEKNSSEGSPASLH